MRLCSVLEADWKMLCVLQGGKSVFGIKAEDGMLEEQSSSNLAQSNKQPHITGNNGVMMVFDGDMGACDVEAVSSKLRHLKRLLAKRFEAKRPGQAATGVDGAEEANQLNMKIVTAREGVMSPQSGVRISVLVSGTLAPSAEATIRYAHDPKHSVCAVRYAHDP
jgi:hypothetical protein